MISLRKSGWRTLHMVGACWRQPNIDFEVVSEHGDLLPDPKFYNGVCKGCFVRPFSRLLIAEDNETASSGSTSEEGGS